MDLALSLGIAPHSLRNIVLSFKKMVYNLVMLNIFNIKKCMFFCIFVT